MSRIILILDMDLNKDHFHSEIQLALEIKPENTIFKMHRHDIFNVRRNKDC